MNKLCFSLLFAVVLLEGCKATPTELMDGFQGRQKIQSVKENLASRGFKSGWTVKQDQLGPNDPRPRIALTELSGPYESSSFRGTLHLMFFNEQLMTIEFRPIDGKGYLVALRRKKINVPTKAGDVVLLDKHNEFSFHEEPDGSLRFVWSDTSLDEELEDWVRKHA